MEKLQEELALAKKILQKMSAKCKAQANEIKDLDHENSYLRVEVARISRSRDGWRENAQNAASGEASMTVARAGDRHAALEKPPKNGERMTPEERLADFAASSRNRKQATPAPATKLVAPVTVPAKKSPAMIDAQTETVAYVPTIAIGIAPALSLPGEMTRISSEDPQSVIDGLTDCIKNLELHAELKEEQYNNTKKRLSEDLKRQATAKKVLHTNAQQLKHAYDQMVIHRDAAFEGMYHYKALAESLIEVQNQAVIQSTALLAKTS